MFGRGSGARSDGGTRDGFRPLDAAGWGACFDRLASSAGEGLVAVEVVASPTETGVPPARRLREIRYDVADEVIEVVAGERAAGDRLVVRHLIFDPRTVAVRERARSTEIAVLDASGVWTRIAVLRPIPARPRARVRANVACDAAGRAARTQAGFARARAETCRRTPRCSQLGRLRAFDARSTRSHG